MAILTVVTPAPSRLLSTPERARDHCGLDQESLSDAELDLWLGHASSAVEGHLGRPLARERVRETLVADDGAPLLDRTPVETVHALTVAGRAEPLEPARYEMLDAGAGILRLSAPASFDDRLEILAVSQGYGYGYARDPFARRREAVSLTVEYTAGYVLPGWPSPAPATPPATLLPGAVELAALETLRFMIERRGRKLGMQSERLGDYGYVAAAQPAGAVPVEVRDLLAPYRRVAVG